MHSHSDIFKHIKRKHEKDIVTVVKSFEDLKIKYEKVLLDVKFIKTCKQGNLLPKFAKVRLSIKNANNKLKQRIGRIIVEDELQRKHHEKEKLKKDIKPLSIQLKSCLNVLVYSVLLHKINIAFRSRSNAVSKRHDKKLFNLRKQNNQRSFTDREKQSSYIIHNFSSYSLTREEDEAFS